MKKGAFILIIIGVFLLLVELLVRYIFPVPEIENFNRINYQILDKTSEKSQYLRNKTMLWKSFPDTLHAFEHKLNLYGYRDKNWKAEKSKDKRVFVIGDSFVEGMMSTQDKTIPSTIEQMADASGQSWEVFNCGMMGIGLNEYMKFIADAVPIFKPDKVVLVLFANDMPFMREYAPQSKLNPKFHSFWKPRLLTLISSAMKGDPLPSRFNYPEEPFYKAVPDPSNPWTFKEAEMINDVAPQLVNFMKKGELNFFRTNWFLTEAQYLSAGIDVNQKLNFIKSYCDHYQAELHVFYVPSRLQVSDYYYQYEKQYCLQKCPETASLMSDAYQIHAQILGQTCVNFGIPYRDLSPDVFKEEKAANHLYWNYDDHMRGKGYQFLGRLIYQTINTSN